MTDGSQPSPDARDDGVRWGMGDAVGGNVASLLLSVVGVVVVLAIAGDERVEDLPLAATALLQLPLWGGLFGAAVRATRLKGTGSLRRDFGLSMQPRDIAVGLAAGFVGQIVIGIIVIVVYDVLGIDTDRIGETAEELADRAAGAFDIALLLLIVVVAAPIVEEVFYRGLWMRSIEKRTANQVVAVVGSSLVFGVVHFQPYDLLALTLAGLLFALLAVRAERLGPAIWAHVAFNLTAVVSLL